MPERSPEFLALLQACRACPVDDTPRLILADWLDDHDDPDWASFIRIQCELARPTLNEAKLTQLRDQEQALIQANWPRWVGALPAIVRELELDMQAATLRAQGRAAQATRLIETTVTSIDPLRPSRAWRLERGLLHVQLHFLQLLAPSILDWLASEPAQALMELQIENVSLQSIPGLRIPDVARPYLALTAQIYIESTRSRSWNAPHYFAVEPYRGNAEQLRELLACPNFQYVRRLDLNIRLARSPLLRPLLEANWDGVRHLSMTGTNLREEDAIRLLARRWPLLARLDIPQNNLGSLFWKKVFRPDRFPSLLQLIAYRNPMGDDGLNALAQADIPNLARLELMNCQIHDPGFISLVESSLLERLTGPQLNFSMNQIGDRGIAVLAANPAVARFSELIFRENLIGYEGAVALAQSPHLAEVTYLDLWKNRIGDQAAQALAESESLANIQVLNLTDNPISPSAKAALRDRYGERVKL